MAQYSIKLKHIVSTKSSVVPSDNYKVMLTVIHKLISIYFAKLEFCPTQVNISYLNPSQICQYSIYLPRMDGRLT